MPFPVIGLIAWLGSALGTTLASAAARYVAIKVVLVTLMTVVLPVVLINVFHRMIEIGISTVQAVVPEAGTLHGSMIQVTGATAYLVTQLRLPEALALILTAVGIRMALKMIPFFRF